MRISWNQGVGALVIIGSGAYAWQAARIPVPWMFSDPLGPRALPLFLSSLTALLGVLMIGSEIVERRRQMAAGAAPHKPERSTVVETPGRLLAFLIALVTYVFALDWLGFMPATFLFVVFGLGYLGERRPLRLIVLGVAFTIGFYLLFQALLGVQLPRTVV